MLESWITHFWSSSMLMLLRKEWITAHGPESCHLHGRAACSSRLQPHPVPATVNTWRTSQQMEDEVSLSLLSLSLPFSLSHSFSFLSIFPFEYRNEIFLKRTLGKGLPSVFVCFAYLKERVRLRELQIACLHLDCPPWLFPSQCWELGIQSMSLGSHFDVLD